VAWRAQLLGWRCLYVPGAVAHHVRTVNPANRHAVPAVLNMHSVKNRFLMRIKNMTPALYRRFWMPTTGPRPAGDWRMPVEGAEIAAGFLAHRPFVPPLAGLAPQDYEPPPGF